MNTNHPVALIEDGELLDDVLRLAAAAGCALERVPDAAAVRQHWASAPLVLLDETGVRECATLGLARHGSVVVVCAEPPPHDLWPHALALGAHRVIELAEPEAEGWLVSLLADVAEAPAGARGGVLAVLGGRGGAGASVFAATVGLTVLRGGNNALLIDCDPLGGGLDLVLGAETEEGMRWPDMRVKAGRIPASALHSALPGRTRGSARMTMLSGAREGTAPEPDAVAAVLEAGRRIGDTVICDLSRDFGDGACAALERADLAVIIVPAEVRACASAKLVARRALDRCPTTKAVVRGPAPGGLRPKDVARAVGIPVLTSMRPEPALDPALEQGVFRPRSRGPLANAARATLRALAAVPAHDLRAAS